MITLTLMALLAQLGAEYKPYRAAETQDATYAVMVGPTTRPGLEQKLLALVQKPGLAIARVTVFETGRMAIYGTVGVGDHAVYRRWESARQRARAPCLQVLDVIRIGPNVASRRVDATCRISEKTLAGSDPRFFELSGTKYEILHFRLDAEPPTPGPGPRGPWANWYVRTEGEVTTDAARAVFKYLRALVPAPNVSVGLRRDPWFLTEGEFPIFYPFDLRDPPTESQYLELPEAVCGDLGSPPDVRPRSCWMNMPARSRLGFPGNRGGVEDAPGRAPRTR